MMRNAIALALAVAIAAAPAAAAETWREFVTADGYTSAVATDSIKATGTQRAFRLRAGKLGDTRFAIADVILDCQSKMVTIGRAELYDKGARTGVKQADPTMPHTEPLADQPSGDEILALVCTG